MIFNHRGDLIKHMPKNAVCAEIGVDLGLHAKYIYEVSEPEKLYLVDIFPHPGQEESVNKFFSEKKDVVIVKSHSHDWLETLPNDHLDWAYVDSDHQYETTLKDLYYLYDKVKAGGYACGHDLTRGYYDSRPEVDRYVPFGVIEAVHHFCSIFRQTIEHISVDKDGFFSYAIKINK